MFGNAMVWIDEIDEDVLADQRAANALLKVMPHPDPRTAQGLAAIRAGAPPRATLSLAPADVWLDDLRVRVFAPEGPAGIVVRIHGGGFAVGRPEHDDAVNDQIARSSGVTVVSPDYRLAPSVSIPEEVDDCLVAARWATATFDGPFVLAGTSAGSHLALSTALRLRDLSDSAFKRLARMHLDCGRYDLSGTPSARAATDDTLLLTRTWLDGFAAVAAPGLHADQLRAPQFSPLYADLTGVPPTLLTVGEFDPLIDDSRLLAARLKAAGTIAALEVWPQAPHSFIASGTPLAALALARVCAWIRDGPGRDTGGVGSARS
jgi:acetyl esterase